MKKILTIFAVIMMLTAFVGCNKDTAFDTNDTNISQSETSDTIDATVDTNTNNTEIDSNDDTVDTETTVATDETAYDETSDTETADEPEYTVINADAFLYTRLDEGGVRIDDCGIANSMENVYLIYPHELGGSPVFETAGSLNWPDNIVVVEWQDGCTKIPAYAIQEAEGLTTAIIPDTVTEIEEWAFLGCKNLNIAIPDSVTKIGERVFYRCENIVATYRGNTYTYENIDQLYADINANSAE